VVEAKSREAGNSVFRKKFEGGELILTGATSAKGLRSLPARYLFLDEVDGYPADADQEGDPVALAVQRTVTYRGRRKIYLCSTPTVRGASRIETAYLESDQRVYEVPCRHCGAFHQLRWADIRWPEDRRDLAGWWCPSCGAGHSKAEKPALLAAGRWRATAAGDGRTAGFHLSALYSPFESWGDIAVEHGLVYRDPVRLKTFINLKLGETWEDFESESDPLALAGRREDFGGLVPAGALVLTAGIDVQRDRLEISVIGWGAGEESWIIEHAVISGDTNSILPWADLDQYLTKTWTGADGLPMPLRAGSIDTGGCSTQAVYDWARGKHGRRIWAIKGDSLIGKPLWPRRPTRTNKGKIPLYILNVDAGKETLYGRLPIAAPGPGFIHLSDTLDEFYLRGLVSEPVRTRFVKGHPVREWHKPPGARNEPLDCYVYALAALHGLKSIGFTFAQAAQLPLPAAAQAVAPVAMPAPFIGPQIVVRKSRYAFG